MGVVRDTLFGRRETPSRQEPTRAEQVIPEAFEGLQQPVAGQISQLFQTGGGPTAPGPFAAGLGANEQQMLQMLQQQAQQPSGAMQAGQGFLQQLLGGQLPSATAMQGGTPTGEVNPFLAAAIDAAQRPLIENFQDVVAPALRAQFTGAGQQIQGQGSSPFQMAAARAQGGLASAMGDIGSQMAFADLAQRQQLGSQEFQQARDLMTRERQQQLEAVPVASGVDRAQLENLLANLEAQALPRMIEQLGIDQGIEEFRRRQAQLMQAISMGGQLGSPTVATVGGGGVGGTAAQPGIFGPGGALVSGFGQFLGNL
jgi:hypothetical protein